MYIIEGILTLPAPEENSVNLGVNLEGLTLSQLQEPFRLSIPGVSLNDAGSELHSLYGWQGLTLEQKEVIIREATRKTLARIVVLDPIPGCSHC